MPKTGRKGGHKYTGEITVHVVNAEGKWSCVTQKFTTLQKEASVATMAWKISKLCADAATSKGTL